MFCIPYFVHVFYFSSAGDVSAQGTRGFTKDPSQLQGSILQTALRKSPQGFGFTIIGGDHPDEFLQVKNILPDGPAAHDKRIAPGNFPLRKNMYECILGCLDYSCHRCVC